MTSIHADDEDQDPEEPRVRFLPAIILFPGPPRIGDLNLISRVFGKYAAFSEGSTTNDEYDRMPRAILFGSTAHLKAAAHAWLTRKR